MTEQWLPVVGYEGLYEVSDLGRVRSVDRVVMRRGGIPVRRKGQVMTFTARAHHGDLKVTLSRGGKGKTWLVHRLVLTAFRGPCPPSLECLHGNGNSADNRLVNLRWGTRSENQEDSVRHGTHNCASRLRCPRKHPLKAPNLVKYSAEQGERNCLACMRGHADVRRAAESGRVLSLQEASDRHYEKIMARAARVA